MPSFFFLSVFFYVFIWDLGSIPSSSQFLLLAGYGGPQEVVRNSLLVDNLMGESETDCGALRKCYARD